MPDNNIDYSDWEIKGVPAQQSNVQSNDWEIKPPSETYLQSLLMAPGRIGGDISQHARSFYNDIPSLYERGKSEVTGLPNTWLHHPLHILGQEAAGVPEAINTIAQIPKNITDYAANRLHLLPKSISDFVSKTAPEDTSQATNALFGQPQYPGESLMRGTVANIPSLIAGTKVVSALNPLKLTNNNIIKDVLEEEKNQIKSHNVKYNNLWNEAKQTGFNEVPVNINQLSTDLDFIKQYKTPREYKSLSNFIDNPSLQGAQKAQSDMNAISRALEIKSRGSSLTDEETKLYDAAKSAEQHIEDNMFKNKQGAVSQELKDQYDVVTGSYRDNVVPYKYNTDIQKYKAKELLPGELVQRLSHGEFAAKKGDIHSLGTKLAIRRLLAGAGIAGAGAELGKHIFFPK